MPIVEPASMQNNQTPAAPLTAAPGTGNLAALPNNPSATDLLKWLSQYSIDRTGAVPTPAPIDQGTMDTLQKLYAAYGTSTGLSPEALTALRTEATSGLQDRYNTAAGAMRTQLQQRGLYGGQLPANSGALLNGFGPLQSDLAQAQSKAGADATLADEQQKLQTLLANNQLAAGAVGMGINLNNSQNQNQLAAFNAGTSSLQTALGAAGSLANLEPTSMKNILLASAISAGLGLVTKPDALKNIINSVKGSNVAGTAINSTPPGSPNFVGPLQQGATAAAPVAAEAGIGAAGAGAAAALPATSLAGVGAAGGGVLAGTGALATPEIAAPALAAGAGAGEASAAGATAASGTGTMASLASFFTNPITIGVGAAIAAAIIWKHSQVHPTADKFVQDFQNPFGNHLSSIVDQFDKAYSTGQLDKESAQKARNEVADLIKGFEDDRTKFSAQGGKEKTVADQAKATMTEYFGANYKKILGKMDNEIAGLQ